MIIFMCNKKLSVCVWFPSRLTSPCVISALNTSVIKPEGMDWSQFQTNTYTSCGVY